MHVRVDSDQRHLAPHATTWRGNIEETTVATDDGTEVGRWENDGGGPTTMCGGDEQHSTSSPAEQAGTDPHGTSHQLALNLHLVDD